MGLPKLTETIIRAGASAQSFQRGQDYYEGGAISNTARQGSVLTGECEGTSAPYYRVRVELDEAGIREAQCSCPYEYGGYCKHVVALLLAYVHHPRQFVLRKEPADLLAGLGRDELAALLTALLKRQPELYDWIEGAIATPVSSGKAKKTRRRKVDVEVYRRQILGILHSLDGMRASEAYWHVGSLANQLREVRETAMKFLDAGDAETALAILLTLVEEAGHGAEFIDDSDGELGGFVNELGPPLAEAILSLDLNEVEREQLADKLTTIAGYLSDYGMDGTIDLAIQAAQSGWEEAHAVRRAKPKRRVRGVRLDLESGDWEEVEFGGEEDEQDDEFEEEAGYFDEGEGWATRYGDLTDARLNVLDRQGRDEEYLALCQKAGKHLRYALKLCDLDRVPEALPYAKKHLTSADEALELAERLRERKHMDEALAIGEHGLKLSGPRAGLGEWLGPVEEAQGRTKRALEAWLAAFPEHPSLDSYTTIKRLAASGWRKLQPEVMEKLRKAGASQTLAEVLLSESEWDEAIKVAEGRNVWYPVVETVADAVLKHRPEWVVKVSLKHAGRLMVEAKSKNYPLAANWLKRAKKAYAEMGQTDEWKAYLKKTRETYSRRPALQEQLARL
jgi:uncharacterized Zn finger protein